MESPLTRLDILTAAFRATLTDAVVKRTSLALHLCTPVTMDGSCVRTASGELVALRDDAFSTATMSRSIAIDGAGEQHERMTDRVCRAARASGEWIGDDLAFRAASRPYLWTIHVTPVPSERQGDVLFQVDVVAVPLRAPRAGEI